jgi:CRISPR-associated protein Cmr1
VPVKPAAKHLDRRASPLFIHIHECGETPVAVVSFLPARFLPEGESDISVGGKKIAQSPENELYRPIHAFLDRLLDAKQRQEPFTIAVELKP